MAAKNGENATPKRITKSLAVRIEADLVDEVRAAAAQLGGLPLQKTIASIVTEALAPYLEKLRQKHNRGRPFWPPPDRVRPGRRVTLYPR